LIFIIIGTGAIYLSASSMQNDLFEDFNVMIIGAGALLLGITAGVIALILRSVKLLKNKSRFSYVFIGILNICLSFWGLILNLKDQMNLFSRVLFFLSFLIGILICCDVFLNKRSISNS